MSGNGIQSDPLIITAETDYVSVEYVVVRHVLRAHDEKYKLVSKASKQQITKWLMSWYSRLSRQEALIGPESGVSILISRSALAGWALRDRRNRRPG